MEWRVRYAKNYFCIAQKKPAEFRGLFHIKVASGVSPWPRMSRAMTRFVFANFCATPVVNQLPTADEPKP